MANFNLNKVLFAGRLTKDLELKQTPSGVPVTSFCIAESKRTKDNDQITVFMDCVAWRQTAEFICKYFHKGSSICVEGELQKREWTGKDGSKNITTEIVVSQAYFVDSKSDEQTPAQHGQAAQYTPPQPYPEAYMPKFEEMNIDNDDLPF